ncbi:hypothetical protein PC110_g531 [Phytophthora cactorum]|uniref:Transposase IS30-like HTH domain-containing protein n=1 Tax=Phytophthora cactorum TaxID=29920 RepID=A0A329T3S4_9STRA|nr:hypothetical protein PC110_g531 [Phytophthora cactorum]
MPRTKKLRLTERERGRIDGLFEAGTSKRGIARALSRRPGTIYRALAPKPPPKARKKAKPPKRCGAPPALAGREARRLVRTAARVKMLRVSERQQCLKVLKKLLLYYCEGTWVRKRLPFLPEPYQ